MGKTRRQTRFEWRKAPGRAGRFARVVKGGEARAIVWPSGAGHEGRAAADRKGER